MNIARNEIRRKIRMKMGKIKKKIGEEYGGEGSRMRLRKCS